MKARTVAVPILSLVIVVALASLPAAAGKEKLADPASCRETAPDTFRARFETSKGDFVIEVKREWSPKGADRFYNLVKNGFYDGVRFFRVVREPRPFMVQFGIHGDPAVARAWRSANIADDPVKQSNKRGTVSFATAGPNTRTTQVFVNYGDNSFLDGQGFSPFGTVVEGMEVVDGLYGGYGDGAPRGQGPDQGKLQSEGNLYLIEKFPKLDHVKKAFVVGAGEKKAGAPPKVAPPKASGAPKDPS